MPKASPKPRIISPIPASLNAAASRPVSVKRLSKLRLNWFLIGSAFGVGMSFFMNFTFAHVVVPSYHAALSMLESSPETAQEIAKNTSAVALAKAEPSASGDEAGKTKEKEEKPAQAEAKPAPIPIAYPITLALKVGKGDTLLDMLMANRVQSGEAHAVVDALKAKFNPGKLKIGQQISVTLQRHEKIGDAAAVKELAIKLPNLSTVALQRLQNGGFNVDAKEETSTAKTFRGYGKVRSSILQAGAEARIPASAMNELVKAFSYDVDFQREIHPGDTIEVLIDRAPSKSGGFSTQGGSMRYAALTLRGKKHEIFRYKNASGDYAWFDGKGNSIRKSLLRTPVDAVNITSGFGMRTHPIMGYSKMHRGVDFGAPTGTPIMAAGDGVVTFKGWKSGYGNFVTIKHNGKYETAYGHISRFGSIAIGSRVKQGQVIAYVGMTGMATGPHLHYEVRENDTQVNPVAKQFNMASGLTGKQLAAFKSAKQSTMNELARLAKESGAQVASR